MRISSRTAQTKKTQILIETDMEYKVLNLSLIQYYFLLFKDMKESKCESSSLWLNAKNQVSSFVFMLC